MLVSNFLTLYRENPTTLIYGQANNGYPISQILKGIAYVIANDDELFGKRPKGGYVELIERHIAVNPDLTVEIRRPELLTPLIVIANARGALIGPVNPDVYNSLVTRDLNNEYKLIVRQITEEDLRNANPQ